MKKIIILLLVLLANTKIFACDFTTLTVNSVTPVGADYQINLTFCAGEGDVSQVFDDTGNFRFTFVGATGIVAFPATINPAGVSAGNLYTGAAGTNTIDYTNALNWFHVADNSGVVNQYCYTVSFTVSGSPTSVELGGMESADVIPGSCPLSAAIVLPCLADAGTNDSAGPYILCDTDSFSWTSNNDYVLPPPGCATCLSELGYAIYNTLPPATPDPGVDAGWSGYYWTGADFSDVNNAGSSSPIGVVLATDPDNTVWFVPITMDDGDNEVGGTSIDHDQDGDGCFDTGTPIQLTYLNPVAVANTSSGCTWNVSVSGGAYEFPLVTGSTGYTYSIDAPAGSTDVTGATTTGTIAAPSPLVSGTYSITITDDGNGCTATASVALTCIVAPDCATAPIITCGQSTTTTLVGAGVWDVTSCGFNTPGTEAVYRFTSTLAGTYSLNITSASGGYIDYYFKLASGTCDATGWTCIDDNTGTGTDVFTLAANTDYYILLDPEATTSRTHTWNISCPVPPPFNCQAIETAVTTADINAACGAAALNFTPTVTYTGFTVATTSFAGALAAADPNADRPWGSGTTCNSNGSTTGYNYDTYTFQVSTTGSYIFDGNYALTGGDDGYAYIVAGEPAPFTPTASPATFVCPASPYTFVIKDDDAGLNANPQITATLTAGVTYTLVATSYTADETGTYSFAITPPAGGSVLTPGAATGEPVVAGYAYTYTITNSAGNIVGIDAAPVDMTAYAEGTYSVCGLHYPTSGFVLPLTDGTVNYATWAATLTDASNATCADVSTDCITVTITCAPACPTLTAQAPAAVVSSESTCSDCALSGGVIAAPSTTCPAGSTLQYSTNGGTTWSSVLPTYNQTTAVTVMTRCNCDVDNTQSSPTNSVTTVPGTCTAVSATAGDNDPACGGTLNLTASGGASYAWTGPNSYTSTAQNPTISNVNGTHDGVYTVVVTGANGCSASANTTVNTITCSSTRTLTIVDPCSCNNDASTSIDGTPTLPVVNGTFDETVEVAGLIAGDVVTVTAISGLYSAPGTLYVPATATAAVVTTIPTATLQGIHVDNVGYSITFHVSNTTPGFEFEGDISIANKCAYPNPDFTIGSFVDCSTPIAITLTHSALEGAGNLGSASFSPTLGGTSPNYTLSPAGLTGTQTITLTYTGFNDGNGGIAPGGPYIDPTAITTPAFPGCQEVIQKTTTVNCPGCAASGTMQWNP